MKSIKLEQKHIDLGAKMTDFAGYNMPVQYAGIAAEHKQVREKVGIFDVSHMGEFWVTGSSAKKFVQHVTSNDVEKLKPGKAQYSCIPNRENGIIDDLLVYCIRENEYMLVVNASNIEKDWNWLNVNNEVGATLTDQSNDYSLFAVQGPKSAAVLQKLTEVDLEAMKMFHFSQAEMGGVQNVIISATGYTGSPGFELYVKNSGAEQLWDKIMEAGKDEDIKPIGLGARDTLRLEAGLCLYGNDLDDNTSPYEAGLGWITKPDTNFINSENLKKQKEAGLNRKLTGFVMEERGIPRQGYLVKNESGEVIGKVTSGTQSPSTKKAIGLAYIHPDFSAKDTAIFVEIRNKMLKARVEKPPFNK